MVASRSRPFASRRQRGAGPGGDGFDLSAATRRNRRPALGQLDAGATEPTFRSTHRVGLGWQWIYAVTTTVSTTAVYSDGDGWAGVVDRLRQHSQPPAGRRGGAAQ